MWQILEHKRLDRRFKSLPSEIIKRYEKWKDIVSISGPEGLRVIRGLNDSMRVPMRRSAGFTCGPSNAYQR